METSEAVSPPRSKRAAAAQFSDLGAVVHRGGVPDGLADEIPRLYNSLLSTLDYLVTCERKQPDGCCVLTEPRHILLLSRTGPETDVLNRTLDLSPEVADRVCRAIFRAYPGVRRLRLEVVSPPSAIPLAWTPVRQVTFMLIDLPSSTDEYYRSLGKSTRKTIRGYSNRLERAFPDVKTETIVPGGRSRDIVDRLAGWKVQRFRQQGRAAYWETDPGLAERTAEFLERGGRCRITYISGREAAIHLSFRIGDTVFGYESAHDPAYDAYRLGFLTMYDAVCAAIESGATCFDAMTGDVGPKEMLGARRVVATQVTVHRSPLRRELYRLGGKVSRHPRGAALLRSVDRLRSSGRR